jgi:hypothetical protein
MFVVALVAADVVGAAAVALDSSTVVSGVFVGAGMLSRVACGAFDSAVSGCASEAGAQAVRSRAMVKSSPFWYRIGLTSNSHFEQGLQAHNCLETLL